MILHIKYMVSYRCKMIVKKELKKLGLHMVILDLGMVEILEEITPEQREKLKKNLKLSGLELLSDHKGIIVENIKNVIIERIHYAKEESTTNYSEYISAKLGYDYTYLSNVFSEVKGITVRQFIILNKIERAKELILYDEFSLKEIAFQLNYNSLSHLASQFKKITGLTPTFYKGIANKRRRNLEDL